MSFYEVIFTRSARKELQSLSRITAIRIIDKIELLSTNPRPAGCKKLRGSTRLWRIRVGEYRIIYDINDEQQIIDIILIRHRNDAYR